MRAAQGVDKKLITDVTVFDVYEGKGIDDGKKSIAIAVTMQPREKTLTDQEIDAVAAKDRGRGDEEDRRHVAGMSLGSASSRAMSASTPRSPSARSPSSRERRADFPASAPR